MKPPRGIIRHHKFKSQLDGLAITYRRRDVVLENLELALARRPEMFPAVPGTSLRAIVTAFYPNTPPLRIFYSFDDENVCLRSVEFANTERVDERPGIAA